MADFSACLKYSSPADLFSTPKETVPPGGTIRRCKHSHYWPPGDAIAWLCCFCNPDGRRPAGAPLSVVLPDSRNHRADDSIFANATQSGRCPVCHSGVHSVEPDGMWKCEESFCETKFKPPKRKHGL